MKQWIKTLFIALLLVAPIAQSAPQSVDFGQLYTSLSTATSARVVAWPMPNCSFITQDNALIEQLVDLLKTSHLKQIPENESFFYRGLASSATLTLADGAVIVFKLGKEYPNEATLDAMVVLPHTQQEIRLKADWSIRRDLFAWAVQVGKPQVFLEDIRKRNRYELTESDYEREQSSSLAVCRGTIKRNNYYRDPTRYQRCGTTNFYQRHPATCGSGWTDLATTSD
jgi:hypothetical protein